MLVGKHDAAYRAGVLYWLAAPTVEEEIPASELERSKMFAPSIHGIEEGLSEIEHLVRVTQVDDAQSIAGVLRRLISNTAGEGTEGKAAVRSAHSAGHYGAQAQAEICPQERK